MTQYLTGLIIGLVLGGLLTFTAITMQGKQEKIVELIEDRKEIKPQIVIHVLDDSMCRTPL